MAKFKIDVKTDNQIAKALLAQGTLTRQQFLARGQLVGIQYRALGRRIIDQKGYGSPESPFEHQDQQSILDKSSFHVDVVNGVMIISVEAPAAQYAEDGRPAINGQQMAIPVKPSAVRKSTGARGGQKFTIGSGTQIRKYRGKYYLFTTHVKAFDGYDLLRKSIRTAFRSA